MKFFESINFGLAIGLTLAIPAVACTVFGAAIHDMGYDKGVEEANKKFDELEKRMDKSED